MILGYPRPKAASLLLPEWLEVATAGLTASAREKIEREISAHYLDAAEAHRSKGESDETAQAGALKELGSPSAAWERFREQYLTEADERFLGYLHATAFKPWNNYSVLGCMVVLPIILFMSFAGIIRPEIRLDFFFQRHPDVRIAATLGAFFITCVLLSGISYAVARASSSRATARWLLVIERSRWFLLAISWCILGPEGPPRYSLALLFFLF